MNIEKALSENQTALLVIPTSKEYNKTIVETIKKLSRKKTCYVTLNKTYDSLNELFQKKKVNTKNIVFIDAISKTFKKTPEQSDKCYYVSSPGALTELSITIGKFLAHGFEYLILDSITNLTIYQEKEAASKFLSNLINKIKGTKTKAVLYALNLKEQEGLIKETGIFVDTVL